MEYLAMMMVLTAIPEAPGVDSELEELVEEVLEQEGSWALAQARIEALAEDLSWEIGSPAPMGSGRRWLPAVALRLTWRPMGRSRRETWEFVVLVAWPLGG